MKKLNLIVCILFSLSVFVSEAQAQERAPLSAQLKESAKTLVKTQGPNLVATFLPRVVSSLIQLYGGSSTKVPTPSEALELMTFSNSNELFSSLHFVFNGTAIQEGTLLFDDFHTTLVLMLGSLIIAHKMVGVYENFKDVPWWYGSTKTMGTLTQNVLGPILAPAQEVVPSYDQFSSVLTHIAQPSQVGFHSWVKGFAKANQYLLNGKMSDSEVSTDFWARMTLNNLAHLNRVMMIPLHAVKKTKGYLATLMDKSRKFLSGLGPTDQDSLSPHHVNRTIGSFLQGKTTSCERF